MCGRGSLCAYCPNIAIVAIHWTNWAANLCGFCAQRLRTETKEDPVLILMIDKETSCHVAS